MTIVGSLIGRARSALRPAGARPAGRRDRLAQQTDLPVLLPQAAVLVEAAYADRRDGLFRLRLPGRLAFVLLALFLIFCGVAQAQAVAGYPSVWATLWKWTPLLLWGFLFNLLISVLAMSMGTVLGALLGFAQISRSVPIRRSAWITTQFFRNAPWLVLLFYCMFLLPFQVTVFGVTIPIPAWVKATFSLALPVMANVSEILRGAVQSIPAGQWESAESLAFSRHRTMWTIILPQCIKRMLPPWMNMYSILTMATVITSIVGVSEVMTLTGRALSAEDRPGLLLPFYSYILLWFFIYCYPIARLTLHLESKYEIDQ